MRRMNSRLFCTLSQEGFSPVRFLVVSEIERGVERFFFPSVNEVQAVVHNWMIKKQKKLLQ